VAIQRGRDPVGAGVLPDNGVVIRMAGVPVPDDGRLALVGDADRGQVRGFEAVPGQGGTDDRGRTLPDLDRVMFDPSGPRQNLLMLELVAADLTAVVVEDHEPRAGGALVDGSDKISHEALSLTAV